MLPEQSAAMSASGAPRFSLFFLMDCATEPVRAWLGFGDYALPPDELDGTGGVYQGVGMVGNIPAMRQLVGGLAERVDFVLDGASEAVMSLASGETDEVRGARVNVGVIFFDEEWQAVDTVAWVWEGTADVISVSMAADEAGSVTRSVSLSVGSSNTDRSSALLGFYTPPDQKRRSPTDTFCDRVPIYNAGTNEQWPAPE